MEGVPVRPSRAAHTSVMIGRILRVLDANPGARVGIISPYKSQAERLVKKIKKIASDLGIDASGLRACSTEEEPNDH